MSQQICSRCRKRKIRCDLSLPACKNCRLADVECTFWDVTLDEEIPCAYVYSLQQKIQTLQLEIQQATDTEGTASTTTNHEANTVPLSKCAYHVEVTEQDGLSSFSRTAYLGPQNSVRLSQCFLKSLASSHTSKNIPLPKHLSPSDAFNTRILEEPSVVPSFPINNDVRKTELHSLVPPSTQRAIIDHYLKVIAPEYQLFPIEQGSPLFTQENPLKWLSSNRNDPAAFKLTIVFAISSTLITRDIDSNMASISSRSRDELQKLLIGDAAQQHQPEEARRVCTAVCASALCELVCPTSGQIWDLLGRAASLMEDLQESCRLRHSDLDLGLRNLEYALLKLEISIVAHFGRPSSFFNTRIQIYLENVPALDILHDDLYVASCLHNISRAMENTSIPSEAFIESLVPLSHQISHFDSNITLASATLYLALHPLITDLDRFTGTDPVEIPSTRMIHLISSSASIVIDHFAQLDEKKMIVSIWLAAEQVLKAGIVWATHIFNNQRMSGTWLLNVPKIKTSVAFGPIIKVSSLLASFAARWHIGSAYTRVWETVVELLRGSL